MHHHDIAIVGHADDIQAAAAALVAAGARHRQGLDCIELGWWSDGPAPVETIAAAHPDVDVSIRRTRDDTDEVHELTIVGGRLATDRKRTIFRRPDGDVSVEWGLCMDEDGTRLDPALLRRVADEVLRTEHPERRGTIAAGILDALLLAEQAGDLARAARESVTVGGPAPRDLELLRRLASTLLTLSCAPTLTETGEPHVSREWRMREALVHAGGEELWSTPGSADWSEHLRWVLGGLCNAITACQDCSWEPVREYPAGREYPQFTPDRHRAATTGGLLSECLQTLALFDRRVTAPATT